MNADPFNPIENPDIQRIESICSKIDEFDFEGAGPELLVLAGFIFELLVKLDNENKQSYLAKMVEFYQRAASERNIIALQEKIENSPLVSVETSIEDITELVQSVQTTCLNLKSGNITIEEQKSIKRRISGAYALGNFSPRFLSDLHLISSFKSIAKQALEKPLDCGGCCQGMAIAMLAGVNSTELAPFAPFINYLMCAADDSIYDPELLYDVSAHGACLALMHACKRLGETNPNSYN